LTREIGEIPETLTAKTGREGGFHFYYAGKTADTGFRTSARRRVGASLRKAELPLYSETERRRLCSALKAIPANISGDKWASYGMALYDLEWIIDENGVLVDVGFEIWDAWSRTSTGVGAGNGEYKGREDLERRWSKFTHNYKGEPFTIKSIYAHAKERGWQDPTRSPVFKNAINQISEAALS
jgi:hypothetical protein